MDTSSKLQPSPINGGVDFSWVFLEEWLLFIVIAIFALFFFNRFIGSLFSLTFKWYIWRKHKVRVKVQAMQLSLLGGRIFFKNFTFMNQDQTICASEGNLTWRYWLHRKRLSKLDVKDESDIKHTSDTIPTRLILELDGVEIFLYNNTGSYNNILSAFEEKQRKQESNSKPDESVYNSDMGTRDIPAPLQPSLNEMKEEHNSNISVAFPDGAAKVPSNEANKFDFMDKLFLRFFPIQINVNKGAVTIGSKNTPSVLLCHYSAASGYCDTEPSSSKLDKYKITYHIDLTHPVIEMKPNIDFRAPEMVEEAAKSRARSASLNRNKSKWMRIINFIQERLMRVKSGGSYEDNLIEEIDWKGLRMYLTEDDIIEDALFANESDFFDEYAKVSTILEAPAGSITYSYDYVGQVPLDPHPVEANEGPEVGNGSAPPEWGTTLVLQDAIIHYGPWADSQRVFLHQMLYPRNCTDAVPHLRLSPGDDRIYTEAKLYIQFMGDTIFRLPTREPSKDRDFKESYTENPNKSNIRPFAWVEVKAEEMSSISYTGSLVATNKGWVNSLRIDLKMPEVRTSVNHQLVFSADNQIIICDLSSPLGWNQQNDWVFDLESVKAKTFPLKDHVALVSDIFADFSSSPPIPQSLFTPFTYKLNWSFTDYSIYLNINDQNIINSPTDFEDNTFLSFQGDILKLELLATFDRIRQVFNEIPFTLSTPRFDFVVDTPSWHTFDSFLASPKVGRANDFILNGRYGYLSAEDFSRSDSIVLDCTASDTTLICYGFIIKYLISIRENYFGESIHFQTLEEYSNKPKKRNKPGYTFTKSINDTDILISVIISGGCIILPANIYSPVSSLKLEFRSLDIDTRFTNYYMDLQANTTPIHGKLCEQIDLDTILDSAVRGTDIPSYEDYDVFLESLNIHGHRMFGLPPTEPTYHCTWEFGVGDILINTDVEKLALFTRCGSVFGFSLDDYENALLIEEPHIYDILFLNLRVNSLQMKLKFDNYVAEINVDEIILRTNDVANERYSKRLTLGIPSIRFSIGVKDNNGLLPLKIITSFSTSLDISSFTQLREFEHARTLQQEHVALHDSPYKRCQLFLKDDFGESASEFYSQSKHHIHPTLWLPKVLLPVQRETIGIIAPELPASQFVYDEFDNFASADVDSSVLYSSEDNVSVTNNSPRPYRGDSAQDMHKSESKGNYDKFHPPSDRFGRNSSISDNSHGFSKDSYENSKYSPSYILDPEVEYDSFIISLGPVNGFLSSETFVALTKLSSGIKNRCWEAALDELQIDILEQLQFILTGKGTVMNIRVLCSYINLKYGNFHPDSDTAIFDIEVNQNLNYINAVCTDLNIFSTVHTDKKPQPISDYISSPDIPKTYSIHSSVTNFTLDIVRGGVPNINLYGYDNVHPFTVNLEGIQFWFCKNEQNVGSIEFDGLDFSLESSQVMWFKSFIDDLVLEVESIISKSEKNTPNKETLIRELVYQLSVASENYGIEYDSPVLTKPAYIIRLSQQHVRANDSWKILVRLRHIFCNVPREWHEHLAVIMRDGIWNNPKDAYRVVVDIFTKWRSWELFEIGGSYIFMHLFNQMSLADSLLSVPGSFKLDIGRIVPKIVLENCENFILIKELQLSFLTKKVAFPESNSDLKIEDDRQLFDVDLRCGDIETDINFECLGLIEEILNNSVNETSNALVTTQTGHSEIIASSSAWFECTFDINVSVLISKWLFKFGTDNCYVHLFGHDVLVSASQNKLVDPGIDGFSVAISSSFDTIGVELFSHVIYQHQQRLVYYIVNDTKFVFACSGPLVTSSKEAKIKSSNATLYFDKSMEDIIHLLENIVDKDFSRVESLLKQSPNISNEEGHSMELNAESNKDHINFILISQLLHATYELGHFTLSAFPLPTLLYIFNMDNCMLEVCRPSESDCVVSFAVGDQSHEIMHYIDKNSFQSMLKVGLGNLSLFSKIRYTKGLVVTDIATDFKEVEIKSISSLLSLQYFTSEKFENDVSRIKNSLASLISTLDKHSDKSHRPTEVEETQILFKLNLKLRKLAVSFPVEQSSIELAFKNVFIELRNTKSLEDAVNCDNAPLGGKISVEYVILQVCDNNGDICKDTPAVIDFHFSVSLSHSYEELVMRPLLAIESDFIKICLSPKITTRVFEIISFLDENLLAPKSGNTLSAVPEAFSTEDNMRCKLLSDKLHHIKMRMSLSKLCFIWLLESEGVNNASAFHLGIRKIILSSEHLYGKVRISGCHLAITKEKNIDIIANGEYDGYSANTAYLPNITSRFIFKKDKIHRCILLDVKGDKLMVTLLPSCIRMLDSITVSFEATVKSIKEKTKYFNNVMVPVPETDIVDLFDSKQTTRDELLWFINLDARFGGGVIQLWNTSDYYSFINDVKVTLKDSNRRNSTGNTFQSALSLTSPAVKCLAQFIESADNLPNTVTGEIFISPSDNTIFPRVLPLMVEMWKDFQELMSHSEIVASPLSESTFRASETSIGQDDSLKAIANLNINIGLRVERQEITMSCEPTARVSASVAFDNFFMEISTCNDRSLGILNCLTPKLTNFRIALQHIFSSETSGYVAINDIILTIMRTKSNTEKIGILISAKVDEVSADFNLNQIQDINIFQDIWRPVGLQSNKQIVERTESGGFVLRYDRATFKSTMPWSINVTVLNVKGKLNFGQSLGEFYLDRFWLVSTKSSTWEQHLTLGLDKMEIDLRGQIKGNLELKKAQLQVGIMWVSRTNNELMVPLVQVNLGIESLECALSYDYELLGFLLVKKVQLSIFNQRDKCSVMADRLAAILDCDSINIYFTSIATTRLLALGGNFAQLKQQSRISYDAILQDSAQAHKGDNNLEVEPETCSDDSTTLGQLRTELDVRIKSATVQVYSIKLSDNEVVRINLSDAHAQFKKFTTEENKSATGLNFQLQDALVALPELKKQLDYDDIAVMNASEFMNHAQEAKGGMILELKSIDLNMETWQKPNIMPDDNDTTTETVIEYIFVSSLGDIDASYNLGSYNSIRRIADQVIDSINLQRRVNRLSDANTENKIISTQELENKLRDAALDSKYRYEPLVPPKIAIPQLKDLGDATPPIEWLGYNRKKLPGLTHQVLTVSLEKIVKEVEYSYFKVLGHS